MSSATLRLDGEFTIYRAAELKRQILDALHQQEALEIDLSAVSEIDSAGVQLLMLVKREAEALGREFHLSHHSPAVLKVFDLFKLSIYLGSPVMIRSCSVATAVPPP